MAKPRASSVSQAEVAKVAKDEKIQTEIVGRPSAYDVSFGRARLVDPHTCASEPNIVLTSESMQYTKLTRVGNVHAYRECRDSELTIEAITLDSNGMNIGKAATWLNDQSA